MSASEKAIVARLRKVALALPDAHEVKAWGAPTFRVKNKLFAMFSDGHYSEGRPGVWIKMTKVNQELMVRDRPDLYFAPPYVGPSGWVGAWLDKKPDWDEIAALLADAWRSIAPKRTLKALASGEPPAPPPRRATKPRSKK